MSLIYHNAILNPTFFSIARCLKFSRRLKNIVCRKNHFWIRYEISQSINKCLAISKVNLKKYIFMLVGIALKTLDNKAESSKFDSKCRHLVFLYQIIICLLDWAAQRLERYLQHLTRNMSDTVHSFKIRYRSHKN